MTPQELLNADLGAVWRQVLQGLDWWGRELAEMVPPTLRRQLAAGAPWLAQAQSLSGPVELWRGGVLVETLDAGGPAGGRIVDLALPAGAALVQELDLPRLSNADLRRLLELNMDRYTPFRADQVYFDAVVVGGSGEGTRQRVRLGVLEKSRGRAALELAEGLGLTIKRLGLATEGDKPGLQFDFMPAVRQSAGPQAGLRTWLWAGCAALAAANVAAAVLLDMNDVSLLEQRVAAQRPLAERAGRLRRTVDAEHARRLDLLTRRSAQEPLRILDAVTRGLPTGAWVQRLEWNGRSLRLVGFRPPAVDLAAALRSPALGEVRSLASDMPTKTAAGQAPFDVLVDPPGKARR